MTASDGTVTARISRPDDAAVARHLRRLATAYPEFEFTREVLGWKGSRWVAERKDRKAPGTRVVITADLMELHAALQRDKGRPVTPGLAIISCQRPRGCEHGINCDVAGHCVWAATREGSGRAR